MWIWPGLLDACFVQSGRAALRVVFSSSNDSACFTVVLVCSASCFSVNDGYCCTVSVNDGYYSK